MADFKARVFAPSCKVLLLKNVDRRTIDGEAAVSTRFADARRVIDLSPWLSDTSAINTSKSVREPAGSFSVVLSDRRDGVDLDSLYGLIEPMDLVEIRMAHEPHLAHQGGKPLPLVMRGVVSNVRRSESMSESGKPSRHVIISGQDYGKFWQILQVFYMPNYPAGANLLTQFRAFSQYGVGFENQPARDFLRDVIDKVLNPFIDEMRGQGESGTGTSPIASLQAAEGDIQGSRGMVSPFGINQWSGGTIYQLLATNLDVGPWCELFVEDREDGPHVVYRNNPFYDLQGDKLGEFSDPETYAVPASDIVALSIERSDSDVANYFWVDAPRFEMVHGPILQAVAAAGVEETFFLQKHRNANPKIYGIRRMQMQTQQGEPDDWTDGNGLPEKELERHMAVSERWIETRRRELIAYNRDNVVFESGSMRLRGREDIKPGSYILVRRGLMVSRYYVPEVSHQFRPFVGFFTTLRLERGTGFVERAQRADGVFAPYNAEMYDV